MPGVGGRVKQVGAGQHNVGADALIKEACNAGRIRCCSLLSELRALGFRHVLTLRAAETRVLSANGSLARLAADAVVMSAGERECRAAARGRGRGDVVPARLRLLPVVI